MSHRELDENISTNLRDACLSEPGASVSTLVQPTNPQQTAARVRLPTCTCLYLLDGVRMQCCRGPLQPAARAFFVYHSALRAFYGSGPEAGEEAGLCITNRTADFDFYTVYTS